MAQETGEPFWRVKRLDEMDNREWESLCDGCGLCCLNKLEDWETGEVAFTSVACRLLDGHSCQCSDYGNRRVIVPECIQLDIEGVEEIPWLPPTCAYRLVHEGQDLYWWHYLVSGDRETVHQAGISARDRTISEMKVAVEDYEDYLIEWPVLTGEKTG
ncbi:YcgN family cysteine cluster protein [Martelella soudanensis]|uniref:YcgN family cysteine cluster protein n=1 Tax=unclassified Martelella TaxID=2629616 RepID=UPI0015DE0691|nr:MULTISPECIES: YcgN family cysteine cluster protein [unclassified Martelella]